MLMTRGKTKKTSRMPAIAGLVVLIIVCFPRFVVPQTMSWQSNFPSIALSNITTRLAVPEGNATATLDITGDVEISADNSTTARLSGPSGDALVTEYKLSFDGDGSSATGRSTVNYTSYESFLIPSVSVTHVSGDDDVDVTLSVKAQNQVGDLADSGSYTATQILTVSWVGP